MKAIPSIFGGMMLFGGLCVLAAQLYISMTAFRVASEVNRPIAEMEALDRTVDAFDAEFQVTGAGNGGYHKPGYEALVTFGEMHDSRAVRVNAAVRLKDLLEANEALPDKELLDAFVMARATRVADAECALITLKLASACKVGAAWGSAGSNGVAEISFTLNFIQKEPFGAIKKKVAYVEVSKDLIGGSALKSMALASAASYRTTLYARAANLCAKMRTSLGNCAISGVTISSSATAGTTAETVAAVELSSLEPLR